MDKNISAYDRNILRELAHKQLEYASLPLMHSRIADWYSLNDGNATRPIVQLELGSFQDEIIPPMLRCESETARNIEFSLYRNFLNYELFDDDFPVPDFFPIGWQLRFNLFGLNIETTGPKEASLGYQYKHPITDLPEDLPKLGKTTFGVDKEGTLAYKAFVEEIFGDILPAKLVSYCLAAYPTYEAVKLMGMEYFYESMYTHPEELHALMSSIADGYREYFTWLEAESLQLPTNGRQGVGQGTWGFTHQLPGTDKPVSAKASWGYLNSQESVGISPDMYEEFIFPYYQSLAEMTGLLAYGCCEPPDKVWQYVSQYKNLRKVSIPPWSDEKLMGDRLRGTNIVFARKPDPLFLGTANDFDEVGYTKHIVNTLTAARGCQLEITFRDIYTIGGNVKKARRAIEIIREQTEKIWH
ncbi:MAG: hypothetical protein FWC73_12830 [Defluviitaleaceae bacterium]|nr:hypothetical protein [Defluviitaleaceae bacterium]